MEEATAVRPWSFTNWKRQENLKHILGQMLTQTMKPKIFIWNNGGEFCYPNVDWQINSSFNTITWPRWFMASMADTEYVCVMDDDLIFTDTAVLRNAVKFLDGKDDNMIIGPYGVDLEDSSRDYLSCRHLDPLPDRDQYVDMIKGRILILKTRALKNARFLQGRSRQYLLSDDIIVCAQTARGKRRFHCVPSLFYNRTKDLSQNFASSDDPEHYKLREKTRREYFVPNLKEIALDKLNAIRAYFRIH